VRAAAQAPPPRPGTKKAEQPRAATIHEYLDWTVTNAEGSDPDDLVRVTLGARGEEELGRVCGLSGGGELPGPPGLLCPPFRSVSEHAAALGCPHLLPSGLPPAAAATLQLPPCLPQDFGGFRVVVLHPRYIMGWPPPTCPYNAGKPLPPEHAELSAPLPPIPTLQVGVRHPAASGSEAAAAAAAASAGWGGRVCVCVWWWCA
jgi:hypothetical protein